MTEQVTRNDGGRPTLGIAMVGHSFMGAVHSQAWRSVGRFFDVPYTPRMVVLGGRNADRAARAAERMGWDASSTDWHEIVRRDDVAVVDICTPGDSHADIAVAALEAGKHVLCEKPLANTVAEAERMVAAAEHARERGVLSMVAFNYRRVPALALARRLVSEGRLGELRHVRAVYLQDWLADAEAPMTWRLRKEQAGSGALGDIGAHIIDAAQFVSGQTIAGVSSLVETFVRRRPSESAGQGNEEVTVDDCAMFTARFSEGAVGSFEATRYALGRKNSMRLELNGSRGSLSFDFESMNELWFHDGGEDPETGGFRRIVVTEPTHPYLEAWWPPGHVLGYEHTFTHEVADLLNAIGEGRSPHPSFADGLRVQRVLEAVERSAENDSKYVQV